MFHKEYLEGLCKRRQWPGPYYQLFRSSSGWGCVVRVNNREYQTSKSYSSELLAKEGAATTAYTICRAFSANDGMYPAGFAQDGVIQGNPVPVGSGRHKSRHENGSPGSAYRHRSESVSTGSRSGGSSPDYFLEPRLVQPQTSSRQQAFYPRHAALRHDRHAPRHY